MNTDNNSILRIIPINDNDNIITKINKTRDYIYDLMINYSKQLGISINCIKSSKIDSSSWVICSVNNNETPYKSRESNVIIVIESQPFSKYDVIISMEINTNNYRKVYENIIAFSENDAIQILGTIISSSGKIKYKPKRYSNNPLIFWRPKNKLIDKYAKKFSIFDIFPFSLIYTPVGIAKGIYSILYRLINGRKSYYKVTMGKPSSEPRDLTKLDSWQTVVVQLGNEKENIIYELENKLLSLNLSSKNFTVNREKIWYWGINGKEEREQLACNFNRAYIFLHIYSYGNDLYIGWDANLNSSHWEEYHVSEGYTDGKNKNINLYSIKPAWKSVNEYDLDDLNFILETVHSNITQVLKRVIKEKQIDQEIDFTIVRESRKNALNKQKPQEDNRNKFRRIA